MPKSKYILIKQRKLRVINYYIYYVPITIYTDFLGKSFAFGSQSNDNPFKVNNFIGNNYAVSYINGQYVAYTNGVSYYETGDQNLTFFAYPSSLSYINYTSPEIPSIANGYWSNGNFKANPPVLHNGGITNCAEYGTVNNCLTFEGLDGIKWLPTDEKQVSSGSILPNRTVDVKFGAYDGNINTTCPSKKGYTTEDCGSNFGQGGIIVESEIEGLNPTYIEVKPNEYIHSINYTTLSSQFSTLLIPETIKLNYGYYIPTFVGGNAEFQGWCVSSYYGQHFYSLSEALKESASDSLSSGGCVSPTAYGKPYPILNLFMYNVNSTNSNFEISDNPVTYVQEKSVDYVNDTTNYNNYYNGYYDLNNYPDGFTTKNNIPTPLVSDEGSSYENFKYDEFIISNSYNSQSSWSDENGYIFYEKDNGQSSL